MSGYTSLFKFLGRKDKVFRGEKVFGEKNTGVFRGEKVGGEPFRGENSGSQVFSGRKNMDDLAQLLGGINLFIMPVYVSKYTKKYKDKKYTYTRKRVELPPEYNDEVAVIMNREDFKKLLSLLAEKLGIEINKEKTKELLNIN